MADFYCDVSAVGNEYQAYADIPTTWGMPQDGNGEAGPGHTAAVAIATIDVAGCTGTSASVGVMGVSLTGLNATGAALATAIAAAINASATAVSATYSALLLPLNKLVYARVNPGLSTQVQIMLRIAGANWVGFTPTQASISPAATISNFAGGADGPFAYVCNGDTTLFGKARFAYGTWFAASAAPGTPDTTSVIHYRSKRSGANLSVAVNWSGTAAPTWRSTYHLYDNGTIWAGDNGTLTVNLYQTGAGAGDLKCLAGNTSHASRGYRNLDINWRTAYASWNGGFVFANGVTAGKRIAWRRVGVIANPLTAASANLYMVYAASGITDTTFAMIDCYLLQTGSTKTYPFYVENAGTVNTLKVVMNGTQYVVDAAAGNFGANIISVLTGSATRVSIEWVGGAMYDTLGVYTPGSPISTSGSQYDTRILLDSVDGIPDVSPIVGLSLANGSEFTWNSPTGPYKAFRYERATYSLDWKGNGTFPHCGAQSLSGDYWSHRVTWKTIITPLIPTLPIRLPVFYRDAAAIKTLTVELYVPTAQTFYLDQFGLSVTYTDSGGVLRNEALAGSAAGGMHNSLLTRTELTTSAKSWTANGVADFVAKKLAITTAFAVMPNTEMQVRFSVDASQGSTIVFYLSPEVGLS